MAPQANNNHNINHDINTTESSPAASTAMAAAGILDMLASQAALEASSPASTPSPGAAGGHNFLHLPSSFTQTTNTPLSLAPQFLAGVIPLADLPTISTRTMLTGTTTYLDTLVLCPGIHKQQSADVLAGGVELPATAAMTTGYVFRTENQATVKYLQTVGVVGALVTVNVAEGRMNEQTLSSLFSFVRGNGSLIQRLERLAQHYKDVGWSIAYLLCPLLTIVSTILCILIEDWWAFSVLMLLITARLINIVIFRRRSIEGWHGVKEPGVMGDLLILMSRDRWIRMRGLVDDLKAVTSGSWLRPLGTLEGIFIGAATTMVYMAGAFAVCSSLAGSLVLSVLLMVSVGSLSIANSGLKRMRMHGIVLEVTGEPKLYRRRLDMAKDMIREHGGDDHWAIGLGMIVPDRDRIEKATM